MKLYTLTRNESRPTLALTLVAGGAVGASERGRLSVYEEYRAAVDLDAAQLRALAEACQLLAAVLDPDTTIGPSPEELTS